jgi:aspartyl-tRNA(Asn)/glutamyl-tRNA(Gln) amidotransferase subunit A
MNIQTAPEAPVGALHHLTIAQASQLIRTRRLSPVELTRAFLDRIEATQPRTHAYIHVAGARVLAAAKMAEAEIMAGRWRGPLHGIPFAVKDNYHVAGLPTTGGSRIMLDHVATETATMIIRLEAAGALLLGKLNTWEYGTGAGEIYDDLPFALARNPWNTKRFTGGSSTGAGVAVASGAAMFALGSDTGGSVRLPAAATGVQGIKATFGRVSRAGILPNCWSCDIGGPLTWTVEDNAIVLNAVAGHDPRDPQSVDTPVPDYTAGLRAGIAGLRIGVIRNFGDDAPPIQAEVAANFEAMVRTMRDLGAEIVEVALPAPLAQYRETLSCINWGESFSIHETDFMERHHLMGRALRDKLMSGAMLRAADYLAAQRMRKDLALATDAATRDCDAVLLPCTSLTAPGFEDQDRLVQFTFGAMCSIHSISGHPAISVATGFDADGMPTAAQVAGRYFDEATVYRVAAAFERASDPRALRPAL